MRKSLAAAVAASLVLSVPFAATAASAAPTNKNAEKSAAKADQQQSLKIATYNSSLNRNAEGDLVRDLSTPDNVQAKAVAEVIQMNQPDVLLINEFDYDAEHRAADLFRTHYLEDSQNGQPTADYPYVYTAPVNTGVPSGFDLNNKGAVAGGDDAWGFGLFPGQYGMVVYSKYPILEDQVRTFQNFLWKDMPNHAIPENWYSAQELEQFPLSSKSHWDIPVQVDNKVVHALTSHPTPPTFDGPEDRNGRRNHDEIRFWADYVATSKKQSSYIYDDNGEFGGLKAGERFVILGDQNADPKDGDSLDQAIQQLLNHNRIQDPLPTSEGGPEAAVLQNGANLTHEADPAYDTADFADGAPGNLRADYVLPSRNLVVEDAGVFWPKKGEPGSELTGEYPFPTSDHRLVWVEIKK
ncbi:endonuclease/exonuclease/phosphatase family protein [Neomicrococcus lactis]